ncbi:hypothetical protein [Actinoplanes utahensis]|uniref:Uncharacterized protein n=1 Tax=Actinoplanes utahensis TaxID=1869 RepID=A0A0A6URW0_ACTUT|nr:hypothetical protein [Actinoplanes utahensis]KHD77743.1 hypothetical protein MB27_09825 [Actinoplanes utahensis]GIF31345.1 hypothetical protein Aut01nite_43310 [Actinoplanes utahensis]
MKHPLRWIERDEELPAALTREEPAQLNGLLRKVLVSLEEKQPGRSPRWVTAPGIVAAPRGGRPRSSAQPSGFAGAAIRTSGFGA